MNITIGKVICAVLTLHLFGCGNSRMASAMQESSNRRHFTIETKLDKSLAICSCREDKTEDDRKSLQEAKLQLNLSDRPGVLLSYCPNNKLGLQANDLVIKVDDATVSNVQELDAMLSQKMGNAVKLTLLRVPKEGLRFPKELAVKVTLPSATSYKIIEYERASDADFPIKNQDMPIFTANGGIYFFYKEQYRDKSGKNNLRMRLYDVASGNVIADLLSNVSTCQGYNNYGQCGANNDPAEFIRLSSLAGDDSGNLYLILVDFWNASTLMYKIPANQVSAQVRKPAEIISWIKTGYMRIDVGKAFYLHDYFILVKEEEKQIIYDLRTGAKIGVFSINDKSFLDQLPEDKKIFSIIKHISLSEPDPAWYKNNKILKIHDPAGTAQYETQYDKNQWFSIRFPDAKLMWSYGSQGYLFEQGGTTYALVKRDNGIDIVSIKNSFTVQEKYPFVEPSNKIYIKEQHPDK
jgi:hypothetical protein